MLTKAVGQSLSEIVGLADIEGHPPTEGVWIAEDVDAADRVEDRTDLVEPEKLGAAWPANGRASVDLLGRGPEGPDRVGQRIRVATAAGYGAANVWKQ